MKKCILILMFLFFVLKTFSQAEISHEFTRDDYVKKSNNQKITAWILLGAGLGMAVTGMSISVNQFSNQLLNVFGGEPTDFNKNKGLWLFYLGSATTLTSIPFFISAHRNKKRAATVAITNQTILWYQKNSVGFIKQPAVTITIGL